MIALILQCVYINTQPIIGEGIEKEYSLHLFLSHYDPHRHISSLSLLGKKLKS